MAGEQEQLPRRKPAFTPRAQQVLERAAKEAQELGHAYVGTEHLLLALISENGIAGTVFRELGIVDSIRAKLYKEVASRQYDQESNQVVDPEGNLVGYLVGEKGSTTIVDEEGRVVRMGLDREGKPVVLDEEGKPKHLEPARTKPILVRFDDQGNLVIVVDAEGRRLRD